VTTNGSFEGMRLVVDLTVGAEWSKFTEVVPDYCIAPDSTTGELALAEFIDQ